MIKKLLAAILSLLAAAAFAAVDVNKATQADLESIKGIGPVIATKILDERKKGAFKDWNDMVTRVKGVGEGNAAKFSADGLTINGAAFTGAPAATAKTAEKSTMKGDAKAPAEGANPKSMKAASKPTEPTAPSARADKDMKASPGASAPDTTRKTKAEERAAKAQAKAEAKAEKKVENKAEKNAAAASAPAPAKTAASAAPAKK